MLIEKVKHFGAGFLVNDATFIPNDPKNSDYVRIQLWVEQGGIVEPEFTEEELLAKAKETKLAELVFLRDASNTAPITDVEGYVISNEGVVTETKSFFVFSTERHAVNPAADPTTILSNVFETGLSIPYVTRVSLESTDRVIINLDEELASAIRGRLLLLNNSNYQRYNTKVVAVNTAETVEAVNAITWAD